MTTITRFAPSPTGLLHLQYQNSPYKLAVCKKYGGKFILRIDDTDQERSKDEYIK